MGGQERFCKGGGVPEMARGLVQWVGRNQGCKGGDVDDGSSTVDRGALNGAGATRGGRTKIANREGSAGWEWRGREGDGTGAGGEEEGPVAMETSSSMEISSSTVMSFGGGNVDWRSNRGAGKWAVAILRGRTNVVDRKGVFRAGGERAWKGIGPMAVWPSLTAATSTRKGSSAGAGWVKATGRGQRVMVGQSAGI
eukprot:scaffold44_cov152-Amphora_coffeaeformis.AAC.4